MSESPFAVSLKTKTAIVIGGGMGGLAASVHLARAGVRVRVLERGDTLGGKLREITVAGRTFPGGPSVFTMRYVFEELFGGAAQLREQLALEALDPLCRHFFPDGSQLDLHTDAERTRDAIRVFSGTRDAAGYMAFREHARKIHEVVRGPFMERPLAVFDLLRPSTIMQVTQIDGMRTLWKAIESFFVDPRLRQLFGRYATYNGSSPFHAPATLAVIAHVENEFGIFSCKGGIYRLAEAVQNLARSLGVEIETAASVDEIVVEHGRAVGVRRGTKIDRADVVVANADVAQVYGQLLPSTKAIKKLSEKYSTEELSSSAYVMLAVADRSPLSLAHHNVFFSRDYKHEFDELVRDRRAPNDPTVYLCADDRVHDAAVTAEERCFFLTNAPPLDERGSRIDWKSESVRCRERIAQVLKKHKWELNVRDFAEQTPVDFAARFPSSRGALYGIASNSKMAAFKRPANRVPDIQSLYLVGGTVHPGAGLPMVCLSAKMAVALAVEELNGR